MVSIDSNCCVSGVVQIYYEAVRLQLLICKLLINYECGVEWKLIFVASLVVFNEMLLAAKYVLSN